MREKSPESRLGARLVRRLTDIRDTVRRGESLEQKFTVRTVILDLEPQEYDAEKVRGIRRKLGVSQAIFAQILGASVATVQAWEQNLNEPEPMARRLLDEIARDHNRWKNILRRSMTTVE